MSSPLTASSLATPNGVRYAMVEGFPTFDMDRDGATYVEKLRINSSDVFAFIREVLPMQSFTYLGTDTLQFPLQAANGILPMFAKQVHLEPMEEGLPGNPFGGDSRSVPTETYAKYYYATITYQVTVDNPDDGQPDPTAPETFVYHTVTGGGVALTISPQEMSLHKTDHEAGDLAQNDATGDVTPTPDDDDVESNANLLQPMVKLLPTVEHNIELPPKASPNWSFIIGSLGKVNKNAIDTMRTTPLYGAEKETVLFSGFTGSQQFTVVIDDNDAPHYQTKWKLSFRLTQKKVVDGGKVRGWNQVYSPRHQQWLYALRKVKNGNKRPLYPLVDMDKLLRNENA